MSNFENFTSVYAKHLEIQMRKYPEQYMHNVSNIQDLLLRILPAIKDGSFNKDTNTFRNACKELGIKHTYKAIAEYIKV